MQEQPLLGVEQQILRREGETHIHVHVYTGFSPGFHEGVWRGPRQLFLRMRTYIVRESVYLSMRKNKRRGSTCNYCDYAYAYVATPTRKQPLYIIVAIDCDA